MEPTVLIFTGGTIDSYYDIDACTPVPYEKSIIPEYIKNRLFVDSGVQFQFIQLCAKDSRDINEVDRDKLVQLIKESSMKHFVITHGTFTLFETARFIASKLKPCNKKIILTGSMIPLTGYYHSDGHFNLGFSLGTVRYINDGIWVCIKGKCWNPETIVKLH